MNKRIARKIAHRVFEHSPSDDALYPQSLHNYQRRYTMSQIQEAYRKFSNLPLKELLIAAKYGPVPERMVRRKHQGRGLSWVQEILYLRTVKNLSYQEAKLIAGPEPKPEKENDEPTD